MKDEDQSWLDYVNDTFGKEVGARVELMCRAVVYRDIDVLKYLNDGFDGAITKLLFNKSGKLYPSSEIWKNISAALQLPFGDIVPEARKDMLVAIDSLYGIVFENFYNVLPEQDLAEVCKEYLSDKEIMESYRWTLEGEELSIIKTRIGL